MKTVKKKKRKNEKDKIQLKEIKYNTKAQTRTQISSNNQINYFFKKKNLGGWQKIQSYRLIHLNKYQEQEN